MSKVVLTNTSELQEQGNHEQFLTVKLAGQIFGIPVVKVRDVLKPQKITKIPLSRPEILGFMNLRGRIVTVIDMRKRLNITEGYDEKKQMFVVVEKDEDLYSFVVDEVKESNTLDLENFEKNPENLAANWRQVSRGVFKLEKELMLVLDVQEVLKF